jgi:zinc protease
MLKNILLLLLIITLLSCSQSDDNDVTFTESQDIEFVAIPNQVLPVVYFYVLIKSGSVNDKPGQEGLAYFTANYLKRGTESYTKKEIEEGLERIGGKLSIRADREVIAITGQILLENLDEYYKIFSEIILKPTFPESEADDLRVEQENALKGVVRNDTRLSSAVLIDELYSGGNWGHPVEGLFSSIPKLKSEDAKLLYNCFVRNNVICGLAGNYPEEFANKFKNDMSSLPSRDILPHPLVVRPASGAKVILVEKEGRDQSQIRIGRKVDYTRKDKAWYPILVANSYLGQHRESFGKLYSTIRSERGLSYGAYSYHDHFQQSGWSKNPMPLIPFNPQYFSIWTYPKTVNTEFAIKMALYEFKSLCLHGISESDLDKIKGYQVNHFPFLIETADQRLAMEIEQIYFGLPDFINQFSENISNVTAETIDSAISEYWSGDDFLIVIVCSDAEAMKAELLTLETALELPSGASQEGLEDINRIVKNLDLNLKPENIHIANAEELFR